MLALRDQLLTAVFPHGFCYQWDPYLVWLHAISDAVIALAYFSIPLALLWFVRRRRDLPFSGMFICFAVFIAACGTTHLIDVWTLWVPSYWFSACFRIITALASLPTAVFLVRLVPLALRIPSSSEVAAVNEELKKQEKILRESEERYRDLVEHSTDLICTHTLDGFLLSVNELPVKLLGYSRDELLNRHMTEFLAAEFRSEFAKYLEEIRETGFASGQMIVVTKIGEQRIWEYRNTLRTDGVSVPVVRGVAHDITERKQAELELQRLSSRLQQSQDEERRKIARDLHDSTGQELVALSAILNNLHNAIPLQKRSWRKSLAQCERIVDRTLKEIRTLSYVLHPPMLDEGGLEDAVRHYADGYGPRTGIKVDLDISDNFGRLRRDTETGLFHVIRESLLNIQRHSGSQRAQVRMIRYAARVVLEVIDQGRGIAAGGIERNGTIQTCAGVGIPGMQERVKQLGGTFQLESNNQGTTVRVMVPVYA